MFKTCTRAFVSTAMTIVALAWAIGGAQAQYYDVWPRYLPPHLSPPGYDEPLLEDEEERAAPPARVVARILRASGYRLVGRPRLRGDEWIAIGVRPDGRRARFVIDPDDGALLSTTLLSGPRPARTNRAPTAPVETAAPSGDERAARKQRRAPHDAVVPPAGVSPSPAVSAPIGSATGVNAAPGGPAAMTRDIGPSVRRAAPQPAESAGAQAAPPRVDLPQIPPPPFMTGEPNGAP